MVVCAPPPNVVISGVCLSVFFISPDGGCVLLRSGCSILYAGLSALFVKHSYNCASAGDFPFIFFLHLTEEIYIICAKFSFMGVLGSQTAKKNRFPACDGACDTSNLRLDCVKGKA